jgi:hypothetical protein
VPQLESLESRTLLSATLFVTAPGGPADATHFPTLQAALMVAASGDTIYLQPGFDAGVFNSALLIGSAAAGDTSIRVSEALAVGQVVSIGTTSAVDPLERALVTAVTSTPLGDYLVTLATPLQFDHTGSPINGTNSNTTGVTIGIAQGLTLTADPAAPGPVVLPFNLELWRGAGSVTVSKFALTTAPGTSLYINSDGNTITDVTVANQVVLTNASHNRFSGIAVHSRLFIDSGSSGNTVADSSLNSVQLRSGTHHNTFLRNAIGSLKAFGIGDSNGYDLFQGNTFTGAVTLVGNSASPTNTVFRGNTFSVATGKPLVLESATGTVVDGNTLITAGSFATALTIHNSDNVVVTGNTVTTTGSRGSGLYAYADGTGSTSVDLRNNVIRTTDGFAISFSKDDSTAVLEARIQANDLRNNAAGVTVWGDGTSGGNVDVGGGSTRFGTSTGGNDFSTYLVGDAVRYAVGLFFTDSSATVHADHNTWCVADPLALVADATHTLEAGGTGRITAARSPAPAPVEELRAVAMNLAAVQTGTTAGLVASFTSSFSHTAADFAVTITWGDGSTSAGTVIANGDGGFDVLAAHPWNAAGSFTFTVSVTSAGEVSTPASGTAAIAPRVLTATGTSITIEKKSTFDGVVATFTDNISGTAARAYVASVAWSDGTVTTGTVVKNADGSFSVRTSRSFSAAGVMVASVSVGTLDGAFYATTSLIATITNKNDKVPGPKGKQLQQLATLVKSSIDKGRQLPSQGGIQPQVW